jgi:peptidoglycan/xylan/chitin deacetylase (PgdA/CDA1 family)
VFSLIVELVPGAAAPSRNDGNDAGGPLDLARARFHQEERDVVLTLRVRGGLPPLRSLKLFPSRVGADDQRYLCLAVEGRELGRRLFCPGGKTRDGQVAVGISSYGSEGATTRRRRIRAGVSKGGDGRLELRLSLREFRAGQLGWAVLSGWTGATCRPRPELAESRRRSRRAGADQNLCLDRTPEMGFAGARILELRRVGCTLASPLVHHSGSAGGKKIALTFDDGPSAYTEQVVRILDRGGAEGTFFELGLEVPGKGAVMRMALRHGHELANHSLRHEFFPGYSSLRVTSARIEAATGFRPCVFRPPGGAINSSVVSAAARNGMSTVLWDVDTRDWSLPGAGAIYSRAVEGAHPGAIVVMHDGGGNRAQTLAALPRIIRTLRARGYKLVTVTRLLGERFIFEEDR